MLVAPAQWLSAPAAAPAASAAVSGPNGTDKAQSKATVLDAVTFGFNIGIGGIYYGWTSVLAKEYSIVMAAYFLVCLGYTCMALCISEVASFFPFGGGSFGYARCIIQPSLGFLVGAAELIEYLLIVVSTVSSLGNFCTSIFGTSVDLEPLWWVAFFAVSVVIQVTGGAALWTTTKGLFFVTAAVSLFYFFSVVPSADGHVYTDLGGDRSETQGLYGFMQALPVLNWVFVGVEALVLVAEDVTQPTKAIPRATMIAWGLMFVLATAILIVSTASFPGSAALVDEVLVLSPGFSHIFGWTAEAAMSLSLPCAVGMPFSYLLATAKLVASMASSKVLPVFLSREYGPNRTPLVGLVVVSLLALGIMFFQRNADEMYSTVLLDLCLLLACFVYVTLAVCYYICGSRYSNLQRQFTSPLGLAGAGGVVLVFSLAFICTAFFQITLTAFVMFVVIMVLFSLYYFAVVRRYEFFSDAEVNTFMKAYVINANLRRKQEIKKRAKQRLTKQNNSNRSMSSSRKVSAAPATVPAASVRHESLPSVIADVTVARNDSKAKADGQRFASLVLKADGMVMVEPR